MGLKHLIKRVLAGIADVAVKAHLLPCRIILKMDGGICSQMHFYLIGKMLSEKEPEVRFDLNWYRECGLDLDGRFCRNFDLLRMFPSLHFLEESDGAIRRIYISSFYHHNDYSHRDNRSFGWLKLRAPLYLDGYFRDPESMFTDYFRKVFIIDTSVLPADNFPMLKEICESGGKWGACSVHIRRGDLAKYNDAYGNPVSVEYFMKAVSFVSTQRKGIKFFIFSDEPEWCEKELIPLLNNSKEAKVEYVVSHVNGSDRGYCDLLLMSQCEHHIVSQGSMGKYAAMLRPEDMTGGMVVLPAGESSREWLPRFKCAKIIGQACAD